MSFVIAMSASWLRLMSDGCDGCLYKCLCFLQGFATSYPQLYVQAFSSYIIQSEVLCINLHTLSGSFTTCTASFPLSQFLSFHFLSSLFSVFLFAQPPHSFLHSCIFGPIPARMYVWSVFNASRPRLCCSCITCRGTEMFIWGTVSWNIWHVLLARVLGRTCLWNTARTVNLKHIVVQEIKL